MQSIMQFRHTLAATLLGAAGFALATTCAAAQTPVGNAVQQLPPQRAMADALAAARRDFAEFSTHQQQTRNGAPLDFPLDISDVQELKDAVVSYGFAQYTVDPSELLAGRSSMQRMAKPTEQWRFVITLRERPIGMATVERHNGRYETIAYGAAVLAKDVDALASFHGNADRSNLRLVRIYQARSDLLEVVSTDGQARFAPLHSARESLLLQQRSNKDGKQVSTLLDESELVQPLRAAVKQNMEASR
jgi:hypothetical protein